MDPMQDGRTAHTHMRTICKNRCINWTLGSSLLDKATCSTCTHWCYWLNVHVNKNSRLYRCIFICFSNILIHMHMTVPVPRSTCISYRLDYHHISISFKFVWHHDTVNTSLYISSRHDIHFRIYPKLGKSDTQANFHLQEWFDASVLFDYT